MKTESLKIYILLQAIGVAKFLTEKKTLALTQKITKLLGAAQDSEIMGTVANNSIKNGNEHIYYNIDTGTTVLLE